MPPEQRYSDSPTVRAILESAGIPFAIASYDQQAVIFTQGDACDRVMHIEAGRVRLTVTARSGQEAVSGLLGTGAFLGEEALDDHAVRRHTATAMTATALLVVARAPMIGLLHTDPVLLDRFVAHIVTRHDTLEGDLADQLLNSSEQRLARALLVLAGCDGPCRDRCPLPHVSQEIIAEMVGTTRSRVNGFIGKFKRLGLLENDGGTLRIRSSLWRVAQDGIRDVAPSALSDTTKSEGAPIPDSAWMRNKPLGRPLRREAHQAGLARLRARTSA